MIQPARNSRASKSRHEGTRQTDGQCESLRSQPRAPPPPPSFRVISLLVCVIQNQTYVVYVTTYRTTNTCRVQTILQAVVVVRTEPTAHRGHMTYTHTPPRGWTV